MSPPPPGRQLCLQERRSSPVSQGWGASEPMSFLALQSWAELGALSGPRDERLSHRTIPTALEALHWILEGHACLDLGSASERPTSSLSLLPVNVPAQAGGGSLCRHYKSVAGPACRQVSPQNVPLLALVLGFRPRPRALAPGSSGAAAAPSLLSPASLLVFRLRRLALGTRSAGDGSAPAGQDRQQLRPGLRPPLLLERHPSMGRGVEGNRTLQRGLHPLRGQAAGPSAGVQLGGLHLHAMRLPRINEQGRADCGLSGPCGGSNALQPWHFWVSVPVLILTSRGSRDEASPLQSPGFLLVKGQGGPRPLTLDLVVGRQEADVREGDPPSVPVVELHGNEVPVIFQAPQACWRRAGSGEAHGPGPPGRRGAKGSRHQPLSSPGRRTHEGRWAMEQDVGFEPGSPGSVGSPCPARHVAMSTYPRPSPE